MKRIAVRALMIAVVALSAREYSVWALHRQWTPEIIVMGLEEKPFVYRALVPWLAHLLVWMGVSPETALTVVIVLSAIGLLYGIKYLIGSFRRA